MIENSHGIIDEKVLIQLNYIFRMNGDGPCQLTDLGKSRDQFCLECSCRLTFCHGDVFSE